MRRMRLAVFLYIPVQRQIDQMHKRRGTPDMVDDMGDDGKDDAFPYPFLSVSKYAYLVCYAPTRKTRKQAA